MDFCSTCQRLALSSLIVQAQSVNTLNRNLAILSKLLFVFGCDLPRQSNVELAQWLEHLLRHASEGALEVYKPLQPELINAISGQFICS